MEPSFTIKLRVITVRVVRKRPIRTREGKEEEEEEDKNSALGCSEDDGFEKDLLVLRDYSFLFTSTDKPFEIYILMQLATSKYLEGHRQLKL